MGSSNISSAELRWFSKKDMSKYSGEWVAIKDKKVLVSGANLVKVSKAAESKAENPTLVKIPEKDSILIL